MDNPSQASEESESHAITLFCWILGVSESSFAVDIDNSRTVHHLKQEIKKENPNALANVDAPQLKIWQPEVAIQITRDLEKKMSKHQFLNENTLLESDQLSTHFIHPAKGMLHVVVRVPPAAATISPSNSDDSNLSDGQHSAEEDGPIKLQKLRSAHPLHKLWMLCRDPEAILFKVCQVQRDESHPLKGIDVPSSCLVLEVQDWIKKLQPGSPFSGILIREEYIEALRVLIEWFLEGTHGILTETAVDEDAMQVDDVPPAPFPNPFLTLSPDSSPKKGPFVLLGHPGIGKTLFLYVLLVLRLQAGLPTVFQSHPSFLYYFAGDGVFKIRVTEIPDATDLRSSPISSSTWCLVDSNQELTTVPMYIQYLDLFIVQSSSPRRDHVKWAKKQESKVMRYFLKPWTLSELFVGRSLQRTTCSERELEVFCGRYGTSARLAYGCASSIKDHDVELMDNIRSITYETLDNIVEQTTLLNLSHEVSHQIFEISPGATRNSFQVNIPSRYLYEKVRNALSMHTLKASARLYAILVRNPFSKTTAGYMLDDAVNDVFHKGGQWAIVRMTTSNRPGPRFTHWKNDHKTLTTLEYLNLGYLGRHIAITSTRNPDETTYEALPLKYFLPGATKPLEDGYYVPQSGSQETFDAFIYESASNTATTIHVTTAKKTHSVKEGGITWLQSLGVKNFRYIAVSTPDTQLDLPFPNKWNDGPSGPLIPDKYLLALESLPI